jgi:hypothetical protein
MRWHWLSDYTAYRHRVSLRASVPTGSPGDRDEGLEAEERQLTAAISRPAEAIRTTRVINGRAAPGSGSLISKQAAEEL